MGSLCSCQHLFWSEVDAVGARLLGQQRAMGSCGSAVGVFAAAPAAPVYKHVCKQCSVVECDQLERQLPQSGLVQRMVGEWLC
jgi:hypothetical protein